VRFLTRHKYDIIVSREKVEEKKYLNRQTLKNLEDYTLKVYDWLSGRLYPEGL